MNINYCLTDESGQYSMDVDFKDEGIDSIGFELVYDRRHEKATLFVDGEEDEDWIFKYEYKKQVEEYIKSKYNV